MKTITLSNGTKIEIGFSVLETLSKISTGATIIRKGFGSCWIGDERITFTY